MRNILPWLDRNFEPLIIVFLFYSVVVLITMQVILRFGFDSGFAWSEEASRFIFIWLMYFCFSYATRNSSHIKISFFLDILSPKLKKVMMIIVDLLFLAFSVILLLSAIQICQSIFEYGDQAVTINISMNVVYGAGVIGFLLMTIRLVQRLIWKIKRFSDSVEVFENEGSYYTGADKLFLLPKNKEEEE